MSGALQTPGDTIQYSQPKLSWYHVLAPFLKPACLQNLALMEKDCSSHSASGHLYEKVWEKQRHLNLGQNRLRGDL